MFYFLFINKLEDMSVNLVLEAKSVNSFDYVDASKLSAEVPMSV